MRIIRFESPTVNEKGEIIILTQHSAEGFIEDLGNGVGLGMLVIPAGFFQMGSPPHRGHDDEHPQHFVRIKSFMMARGVITQAQWKAVVGKMPPCRFKGDSLPVERVSWEDAQRFCQRLSKKSGRNYHLPSEAQWEYACRAGTTTPFGFGESLTTDLANYVGEHTYRSEPHGVYRHQTTETGTFPPNAFGLYDMHGNLWEWCEDSWADDYSSAPRDGSAYQTRNHARHVARGGSWHEPPENCRSALRIGFLQSEADEFMGFRIVCDIS